MGTIVVGIDGSAGSRRALTWALGEARLRGDEILAVHAWSNPVAFGTFEAIVPAPLNVDLQKEAGEFLGRVIKDVTGGDDSVPIRREVTEHSPATALVHASRDADMLVLGSRGLGGFRGLLLGSVGQQCAHHAHCPVVLIPHEEH